MNKSTSQQVNKYPVVYDLSARVILKLNRIYLKLLRGREKKRYQYNLCLTAIFRDEDVYLKEWIEYYKMLGVDHFYLYDHISCDSYRKVLSPYIEDGTVTLKTIKTNIYPQVHVYTQAIRKYRYKTKYMMFVDIDEFVVPVKSDSIVESVESIFDNDSRVGAVGINWLCYGSSGYKTRPDGLVIESYLNRAKDDFTNNKHVKTICNPRRVALQDIHVSLLYPEYYEVNEEGNPFTGPFNYGCHYSKLRINHYSCKSEEEESRRYAKGFGNSSLKHYAPDVNEVHDDIMMKYVPALKEKM